MIVSHSFCFNQKNYLHTDVLIQALLSIPTSFKSSNTSMGVSSSFVMEYLKFRSTKHIY